MQATLAVLPTSSGMAGSWPCPTHPQKPLLKAQRAYARCTTQPPSSTNDGTPKTHHVTTNAIIEVDEAAGTATSRSYYTVTQATPELPLRIIITGRYHDTFQRIDGEWWFDTRIMFVDQMGDLSHHLLYSPS